MRLNTAALLVCLILVGLSAEGYKFNLHALHKFGKKHLKTLRKAGGFSVFFRPHIFLIPHRDPQLRHVVVVPSDKELYHPPTYRGVPKILEGIDPVRLAMDWPHSVTPGGPGPEWW